MAAPIKGVVISAIGGLKIRLENHAVISRPSQPGIGLGDNVWVGWNQHKNTYGEIILDEGNIV